MVVKQVLGTPAQITVFICTNWLWIAYSINLKMYLFKIIQTNISIGYRGRKISDLWTDLRFYWQQPFRNEPPGIRPLQIFKQNKYYS